MPDPADAGAPLADRARAYLHTNCAFCHLPNGPTPIDMDLRYGTPLAQINAVDVTPTTALGSMPNMFRIASQDHENSLVWELMGRIGGGRMPPLGSNRVDAEGVAVISQWIDAGPD